MLEVVYITLQLPYWLYLVSLLHPQLVPESSQFVIAWLEFVYHRGNVFSGRKEVIKADS